MKHYVAIRFDIDTHKCIKQGVPRLLELAEKERVPFSFFLNAGKSVNLLESIKDICKHSKDANEVKMMSAIKKLGIADYLYAAFFNPCLIKYKKEIIAIGNSSSELAIHGGKNHGYWMKHANEWDSNAYSGELKWALAEIRKLIPDYSPSGFLSPGFVSNHNIDAVLKELDFKYSCDYRCSGEDEILNTDYNIPYLGTNLCGEPGGVAFFEYCRVMGMNDQEIVTQAMNAIENNQYTVVYDHPYYAGINELGTLKSIIERIHRSEDIEIVTMEELLEIIAACKEEG